MTKSEVAKLVRGIVGDGYWHNVLYGTDGKKARAEIASAILGRKVSPSSKEAQWGNFCAMLATALNVTQWTCIANREKLVQCEIEGGCGWPTLCAAHLSLHDEIEERAAATTA